MNKFSLVSTGCAVAILALALVNSESFAGSACGDLYSGICKLPGEGGGSAEFETQFLGGLQWNFGSSAPELVLGVRRTRTDADDTVVGGKLDFAFPLNAHFFDGLTFRAMGLAGDRDVQGEFGLGLNGFDFKPLIAAGAQGPYVNGGANYIFGVGLQPYLGANSLQRPRAAKGGGFSCPAGYVLIGVDGDAPYAKDGKTCAPSAP
jgi:hypothetical protein